MAGAADIAVRIGALPDSSLVATRLGSMRTVIVASPALLGRHRKIEHPADLTFLQSIKLTLPRPTTAHEPGKAKIDWPNGKIRLMVPSTQAAIDAAEAGFVRVLHHQAAETPIAGRLRLLFAAFEGEPAPVHILHAPLSQLPQKTLRFLNFESGRLRASLIAVGKTWFDRVRIKRN